jgi:hypothetical protein
MPHTNKARRLLTLEDIQSVIDPSLTEVVDWLMSQEIWIDQMITCQFLVKAAIEASPIKDWYYKNCKGVGVVHGVQSIRAMKPFERKMRGAPQNVRDWAVDTLQNCRVMRDEKAIVRSIELGIMYAYRSLPALYWLKKIERMDEWMQVRVAAIIWWRMFAHAEFGQRITDFDKYISRYVPMAVEPCDEALTAALVSVGIPKRVSAQIAKVKPGKQYGPSNRKSESEPEQEEGDEAEDDSLADSWAQSAIC